MKKQNLNIFKQLENTFTSLQQINDEIITNIFYPNKKGLNKIYCNNVTNPYIIDYLNNRFKDSSSIEETIKRIKLHIEEKPLCPTCGKPVNFIGKPSKLFTTYCSNKCAGKSPSVIKKKQHSDKLKNNGELGWVISNKNKNKIENRKHTLLEKYGTTNVHSIEEIHEKAKQTSIEHYGTPYPMQNPEYAEKHWDTVIKNNPDGHWTSKPEKQLKTFLMSLYPDLKWQYRDELYRYKQPNNNHRFLSDFYIPCKDLFIEYQGYYTHHTHPFDPNNQEDIEYLKTLEEKRKNKDLRNQQQNIRTSYNGWDMYIKTWTVNDPLKRKVAHDKILNLLEIWPTWSNEKIINEINKFPNIK